MAISGVIARGQRVRPILGQCWLKRVFQAIQGSRITLDHLESSSTRRAAKTDSNQQPIVQSLRDIFGPACVFDTSAVGQGFPDIVIGVRGVNLLMEIKTDKGKLTDDQIIFHRSWPGNVVVVRTLQEALDAITKATT